MVPTTADENNTKLLPEYIVSLAVRRSKLTFQEQKTEKREDSHLIAQ